MSMWVFVIDVTLGVIEVGQLFEGVVCHDHTVRVLSFAIGERRVVDDKTLGVHVEPSGNAWMPDTKGCAFRLRDEVMVPEP